MVTLIDIALIQSVRQARVCALSNNWSWNALWSLFV